MQSKCRGEKVESKIEIGSSEPCLNVKIESQSYALFDVNSPARFRGFAPRQKACWRKPAMPSSSSRSDVRLWEREKPRPFGRGFLSPLADRLAILLTAGDLGCNLASRVESGVALAVSLSLAGALTDSVSHDTFLSSAEPSCGAESSDALTDNERLKRGGLAIPANAVTVVARQRRGVNHDTATAVAEMIVGGGGRGDFHALIKTWIGGGGKKFLEESS